MGRFVSNRSLGGSGKRSLPMAWRDSEGTPRVRLSLSAAAQHDGLVQIDGTIGKLTLAAATLEDRVLIGSDKS
jgi:hypothetical protein